MATYLWGTPVDIEIRLDAEEARRQYEAKLEKDRRETLAVYLDGESVVGQVRNIFCYLELRNCSMLMQRPAFSGHSEITGWQETRA